MVPKRVETTVGFYSGAHKLVLEIQADCDRYTTAELRNLGDSPRLGFSISIKSTTLEAQRRAQSPGLSERSHQHEQ